LRWRRLGRLGWLRGLGGWLRRGGLRDRRRRNGYGWTTWPRLNGWRDGRLGVATGDGDARPSNYANGDRASTGADEKVASRRKRTNSLAS
jgi:hypothetical protein